MRIDDYKDRGLIERLQTAVDNEKPHVPYRPSKLQVMMCKHCRWRSSRPYEMGWCDYSLTHDRSNEIIWTGKCQVFEEGDRDRRDEHPWEQDEKLRYEQYKERKRLRKESQKDFEDRRRRARHDI